MSIIDVCERHECARFYKHNTPRPTCIPGQGARCFSEVDSSLFPAWNHLSNQVDISALSGIFPTQTPSLMLSKIIQEGLVKDEVIPQERKGLWV
jgi:hypothetical protein